jgi:paraquat-inducible protein A
VHRVVALWPRTAARCTRCDALLYARHRLGLDAVIALYLTAAILFLIAVSARFITLNIEGLGGTSALWSGATALWREGMPQLALVVLFLVILAPAVRIACALGVVLPIRLGYRPWLAVPLMRARDRLRPWAMLEVYLLAALVAYVKLRDLAQVELGPGLWALGAAIVTLAAAEAALDRREVWDRLQPQATLAALRARPGRVTLDCHTCGQLTTLADGTADPHCPRCHGLLHRRKPDSLERAWGLVAAAMILYLPANLYPVMTFVYLGSGEPQTILQGVSFLLHEGMWPLAALIFFASVLMPVLKIVLLILLLVGVQRGWTGGERRRTQLYRLVEGVGRWSMVDVVRFDATQGGEVVLDALWRVYGRDGERLQQQSRSVITRALPAVGENGIVYDAIVVVMSEATGELAQTIAAAVRGARR